MDDLSTVMFHTLSVAAAIIPTVAYVLLVWRIDRHEREPVHLLVIAFVWGAIPAVLLAVIIETAFDVPIALLSQDYAAILGSSLVAPPVEEALKGLALWAVYRLVRHEFDSVLDGIVYGSIVGFGFAMTENVFYFWSAQAGNDLGHWVVVVLGRAIAFGFNHAMFTSFTGIGFGLARYRKSRLARWPVVLAGLGLATLAHALHNLFAATNLCLASLLVDWSGVLVVLAIMLLAWQRERAWIRAHLADEVQAGLLSLQEFGIIASRGRRYRETLRALTGSHGMRQARLWSALVDTATELAFKKHQLSVMGEERDNSVKVARLQQRLRAIRQQLYARSSLMEESS
jgi:RsiW-degrading membrane proteinase PrsW (M82 family)